MVRRFTAFFLGLAFVSSFQAPLSLLSRRRLHARRSFRRTELNSQNDEDSIQDRTSEIASKIQDLGKEAEDILAEVEASLAEIEDVSTDVVEFGFTNEEDEEEDDDDDATVLDETTDTQAAEAIVADETDASVEERVAKTVKEIMCRPVADKAMFEAISRSLVEEVVAQAERKLEESLMIQADQFQEQNVSAGETILGYKVMPELDDQFTEEDCVTATSEEAESSSTDLKEESAGVIQEVLEEAQVLIGSPVEPQKSQGETVPHRPLVASGGDVAIAQDSLGGGMSANESSTENQGEEGEIAPATPDYYGIAAYLSDADTEATLRCTIQQKANAETRKRMRVAQNSEKSVEKATQELIPSNSELEGAVAAKAATAEKRSTKPFFLLRRRNLVLAAAGVLLLRRLVLMALRGGGMV